LWFAATTYCIQKKTESRRCCCMHAGTVIIRSVFCPCYP
jgi:hypothetical protein